VSPTGFRAASPAERRDLMARLAARPAPEDRPPLRLSRTPEMRRRPPRRILYARELGPYTEVAPVAWARLSAKLDNAGISMRESEHVGLSYDDPQAVSEELLRYDAGIVVGPAVTPPAGTCLGRLDGGDYAVFQYHGPYRHIAGAFVQLFRGWVVRSGARVRRAPCLEIYCNHPGDVPEHDLLTELLIPVKAPT